MINNMDVLPTAPTVKINNQHIKRVKCIKVLGVQLDEHLKWT